MYINRHEMLRLGRLLSWLRSGQPRRQGSVRGPSARIASCVNIFARTTSAPGTTQMAALKVHRRHALELPLLVQVLARV